MAKTQLYDFDDYRAYLQHALPVKGAERGMRVRLAQALGCQGGFISQVLGGSSEFSLEHAIKASRFLGHTQDEQEYFLLLVQYARAGSKELSEYFEAKIKAVKKARREIKELIKTKVGLTPEDQSVYYSSWDYAAIHMALSISSLRTRRALSEYFALSLKRVSLVLEFLQRVGLAEQKGESFVTGPERLHLPSDSPLIPRHHTNWRVRAIDSFDDGQAVDLHYSMVMSISHSAAEEIRKLLLRSIEEMEPVMRAAKDEDLFALNLDLFALSNSGH